MTDDHGNPTGKITLDDIINTLNAIALEPYDPVALEKVWLEKIWETVTAQDDNDDNDGNAPMDLYAFKQVFEDKGELIIDKGILRPRRASPAM